MSRPFDWSPLELEGDPIPGDPDTVHRGGQDYLDVANAITRAAAALRSMELDSDESQATDELIRNAETVAEEIERARDRYRETAWALLEYAPRLSAAQDQSVTALEMARTAREDAQQADAANLRLLRLADGAEDKDAATDYRRAARVQEDEAAAATATTWRARGILQDAIDERDAAARDAAARIQGIIAGDGLNDTWWDEWGADLVAAVTDIAGWVSTIAGVLALCVSWIPVIGQALAGVLLLIAGVAAVVNAIGNIALASTGERDWDEAAISIAGAALSVVGLGAVARGLGKVASVARINRIAGAQPLGPGETMTLVPLRNANRYSVPQLRESEALWRSPVRDLPPDTPLYRLYGDGSGQIGGSFGSIRPTTLDFPHNSLGLPANNSMERMATFRIDDMSGLVNQRHALPYQGTLGGAPEYVFPRGGGVSVVDDVPFRAP